MTSWHPDGSPLLYTSLFVGRSVSTRSVGTDGEPGQAYEYVDTQGLVGGSVLTSRNATNWSRCVNTYWGTED